MRKAFRILLGAVAGFFLLFALVIAGLIAFGTASPPAPMHAVEDAFNNLDYRSLPPLKHYPARDGEQLAYRAYPAGGPKVAVLVHGSSGNSESMHALAQGMQRAGVTAYTLDMRGHGDSGTRGDIDYRGQLDDDLDDFVRVLRRQRPHARAVLVGFSAGGGFALRYAGGPYGKTFQRYVLVAPYLSFDNATLRPGASKWASDYTGRIIALSILNRLGIHWFDGLPVLAFAVAPESARYQTATYSYRLMRNFQAGRDWPRELRNVSAPVVVLDGADDEIMNAGRYAPELHAVSRGIPVHVVPGLGHAGMVTDPRGIRAIVDAVKGGPGS